MRRVLFRTLIALLYLLAVVPAQAGFVINSFSFASTGPASISFVGCASDASDSTLYIFSSHDTGIADPTRSTIIGVTGSDAATNFSISAVSLNGSPVDEVVDSANAGSLVQSGIYIISNPSGANGDINVTFSEAIVNSAVCVWAAYNLNFLTATDTAAAFQTAAASIDLSLDVATEGVAVGMSVTRSSGEAVTWVGLSERSETTIAEGGGNAATFSGADAATAGTPLTVSADWSGSNDSIGVSASFR